MIRGRDIRAARLDAEQAETRASNITVLERIIAAEVASGQRRFIAGESPISRRQIRALQGAVARSSDIYILCRVASRWGLLALDHEKHVVERIMNHHWPARCRSQMCAAIRRRLAAEFVAVAPAESSVGECQHCDGEGRLPSTSGLGHHCAYCDGTGMDGAR